MGVSGGGGEPRVAFVVDVEAVDGKRFTPASAALRWLTAAGFGGAACEELDDPGGG